MTTTTEKIVDNKLLTLFARASMLLAAPLMAGMLGTAGWYFNTQSAAFAGMDLRFGRLEAGFATHAQDIALLKQSNATDQIQRDRDQVEIKTQLERLQSSVSQLSSSVAALTAVLEAERRSR